MNRWHFILPGLFLLAGASGCIAPKQLSLRKQVIRIVNEVCDILSQIDSGESARQWAPELKNLKERVDKIGQEATKIQNDTLTWDEYDDIIDPVTDLITNELKYTVLRLQAESQRLANPNAPANIKAAWRQLKTLLDNWRIQPALFQIPKEPKKSGVVRSVSASRLYS